MAEEALRSPTGWSPNEDADVSAALAAALEVEGLEIHTGARVNAIERSAQAYTVRIERGSLRGTLEAEELLVATGVRVRRGAPGRHRRAGGAGRPPRRSNPDRSRRGAPRDLHRSAGCWASIW